MKNLIKPVDYATQMGISRQAVYAKIKKGILNSKNIGGKIFISLDSDTLQSSTKESQPLSSKTPSSPKKSPNISQEHNHKELLQAKDETITILKETVQDLKETNKMIVSTMRGEVDLLKDAFGEMKTLYRLQLEHKDIDSVELESDDEVIEVESDEVVVQSPQTASKEWIMLDDFLSLHKITKEKKQKTITKLLKKHLKRGDTRISIVDGEIQLFADANFSDILRKI